MVGLGTAEIILIMAVILLVFGAKKLPELARGLGKGIREFKDATQDIKATISNNSIDYSNRILFIQWNATNFLSADLVACWV